MPYFGSDNDRVAQGVLERWRQAAADAIDDIKVWCGEPSERVWHAGPWPYEVPGSFCGDTGYLCAWVRCNVPYCDPTPIERVYDWVASWYANHNADDLPGWPVMMAGLDKAMMVCTSAETVIRSRTTSANPAGEVTCYSPAELCGMLDISGGTLRKYAEAAGVPTPRRGGRDHRYDPAQAEAIIRAMLTATPQQKAKERCRAALERVGKSKRNRN